MQHPNGEDILPDLQQPWATVSSSELGTSPRLVRDRVRTHAGHELEYVYRPRGQKAALVIPVTNDGRIVLLRQYRYPIRATLLEIVAGGVEAGEDALTAARRELREEIGGSAREFVPLPLFCPQPSFTGQVFHPFVAFGVQLGESSPEESELIALESMPVADVYRALDAGEITNAPSALTLFYARPLLMTRGFL